MNNMKNRKDVSMEELYSRLKKILDIWETYQAEEPLKLLLELAYIAGVSDERSATIREVKDKCL